MTKDQITKLVELQAQKEYVEKIYDTLSKAHHHNIILMSSTGYNIGSFSSEMVPDLTAELKELLHCMIWEYLEDITANLNALTLCKENGEATLYKPTEI